MVYYYFMLFPMEALVASHLSPDEFAVYMATGTHRGTAERLIFIEIERGGGPFDWDEADEHCARAERQGEIRHSAYLAVYRVLEQMPMAHLGELSLVTKDGRRLALQQGVLPVLDKAHYLYQELCPAQPLVVSNKAPKAFIELLTSGRSTVGMPRLALADIRIAADLDASDAGDVAYHNRVHLKDCLQSLGPEKASKVVDRSILAGFQCNQIASGIYLGDGEQVLYYGLPDKEILLSKHYDWAKSAQII